MSEVATKVYLTEKEFADYQALKAKYPTVEFAEALGKIKGNSEALLGLFLNQGKRAPPGDAALPTILKDLSAGVKDIKEPEIEAVRVFLAQWKTYLFKLKSVGESTSEASPAVKAFILKSTLRPLGDLGQVDHDKVKSAVQAVRQLTTVTSADLGIREVTADFGAMPLPSAPSASNVPAPPTRGATQDGG